jgi:tetratricopeptide (TPR) repeat protein
VQPFRRREGALAGIAAKLGVSTVLDGSVRLSGDRVRIVASLVEAESGRQLWAETYDRNVSDIFAIQTDVAVQMAAALEAALTPGELSRMSRSPTHDLDAYRSFLQGRRWLVKYTRASMARALDYFEVAVARDPQFALAWAALAATHLELTEGGGSPPEFAYPKTADAIAKALAIDSELGAAYCARGHLKMVQSFDWPGAESDFRRALELSPGLADAHNLYARLCGVLGRFDEAIALAERAQELDPEVHKMDVVTILLRAGRIEEALRRAESAVEVDADSARARATLGWAYLLSGRASEGIVQLEKAVALAPTNAMWLGQLGLAKGMTGNEAVARDILRQLDQRSTVEYVSPYYRAYVLLGLGETDRALQMIEHAVANRSGPAYGIKGSFLLSSLKSHPRFLALLEMMNLR